MRYSGSKGGCGKLAQVIQSLLQPGDSYWEPFVGAGKVMAHVRCRHRYGSDIDIPIITLLKAVQKGWAPMTPATEEQHAWYKKHWMENLMDPMVGFLGYGCSHGGMFFHRYIHPENNHGKRADIEARDSLLKQRPRLMDVGFWVQPYDSKRAHLPEIPDVVYCDPPYSGTFPTGSVKEKFDHDKFWSWAIGLSKYTTVLVSEYDCPYNRAEVVWQKEAQTRQGNNHKRKTKTKVEKLYLLKPTKVGFGIKF